MRAPLVAYVSRARRAASTALRVFSSARIAASPELYFDMDLAPGDIQWLSNHTILHARTGYGDYPEPERKRHLLRLWLSLD